MLDDGSRIGVIGGGPAGSFFAYFLLKMAESLGLHVTIDIYEPRFFNHTGPAGCNHCGGIISESLVQLLATEGINLPQSIVQRGIDSYVLHMDVGDVRIQTPLYEKRIASVFRGNGPRHSVATGDNSFDRYLLELTASTGANIVRKLVNRIDRDGDRPRLCTPDGCSAVYDLVAVTTGINSQARQLFARVIPEYKSPKTLRTFISEFHLGTEVIEECFGTSMHVFLLDLPRLEFAAIIPKGEFVTLCILGDDVDEALVDAFLNTPEVKRCFPGSVIPVPACHCFPLVNVATAIRPYAERMVWIGDCGTARLYKDGIGSAYRMAKTAATTAVFHGISADDFERYYRPACDKLNFDNMIAKIIFGVTRLIQKGRFLRRSVLRMTANEQAKQGRRDMSSALWDVFTGSEPYKEVLLRSLNPCFPLILLWNLVAGNLPFTRQRRMERELYGR
jgi:flavin-dependent dehydrogenase